MHCDATAAGLVVGYVADRVLGDPQRHHPVAWFGSWAGWVERRVWAPSRVRGAAYVALVVTPPVLVAGATIRRWPGARGPLTAVMTWAALGGRSLEREALAVHALLVADDLPGARVRIRSLVGRDTSQATADDLARAVVESLAENQSDAVAATLVWGALLGAPGVVLHRCVNTLDAMVGHRTERYDQFGWAAARFDDALNWLPARASVIATAVGTRSPHDCRDVMRIVRRDAPAHPSPNAGPVEAAAAAALGVRIGGTNVYAGHTEDRGTLGDGHPVTVADIPRAATWARRTERLMLGAAVLAARCSQRRDPVRRAPR